MNKWIGIIRLTKDVDIRYTQDQMAIAHFGGACERKFKKEGQADADFFSFAAFGKTAETLSKYTKKGTKILVEGELNNNHYEKDGVKHYAEQIIVSSFDFCESKKNNEIAEENAADGFIPLDVNEEELPFL